MSNVLIIGKKALTWTTVVTTIVWAMSLALLVMPLSVGATAVVAGDLIVGTASSATGPGRPVYYYGADAKRYLFSQQQVYQSWYGTDFSAVKTLTEAELGAIPLGGNVTIKPGYALVKVDGPDAKVYAVAAGGVLRHVATEAVAVALYGADWAKNVKMVAEGFFTNYTTGTAVSASADYDKAAVLAAATNIGVDKGIGSASTTPAATGALSVAVASDSPAAGVLPGGASSVVLLKFNVTAGAAAQTITGVTVKSAGVGSANDFSAIYLYDGATRLTSGRTLASQTRQTEFAALNIAVAANTTKTLSVVVDVNSLTLGTVAISGDTHAFQVTALATTATVSGLPVTGATNSIGSQGVGTVVLTRGSDPANPTIGQTGVAIGEFRLTNNGTSDMEVRRAIVTVGGTVSVSDLSSFALYQSTTKIADGTVVSDRVTFDMSSAPFVLSQGTNRLFTVKANVAGRGTRTITTYIDSTYPTDLLVVDKLYGYGATTTFTSFAAAATAAATPTTGGSFVTTQGGRVTVAFNGPSAADVARGTQDVTFYKFSLTAGDQALDVREIEMSLMEPAGQILGLFSSGTTNYFTDIKIKDVDTGAVLMGPVELSGATYDGANDAATQTIATWNNDFTQSWTLNAGQTRNLVVTADVASTDVGGSDITGRAFAFRLNAFPEGSIREVSTNQNIATTDIVGGQAAVSGNNMTVRASSLTVQLASTPVSGTSVKGSTAVQMVGLSVAAGTQSDIKVTQMTLTGQGRFDADSSGVVDAYAVGSLDDILLTAQLFDGATAVSTVKSPTTSGTLVFDNMNWTVPAGSTKKLVLKVALSTAITNLSAVSANAWIGVSTAASIVAQDKDGNSVTATDGDATWNSPVNSASGVVLTVANTGSITAVLDGESPLSTIVLGGSNGVSMLKTRFTAANESFMLRKVRVINDSADDDTGITSITLRYPKQDGTTATKTAVLSSAVADINDLDMYLGLDTAAVLEVQADYSAITASGVSADTPQFSLDFDTNFEAVGQSSGTTVSSVGAANIDGNAMTVRKTKPTVTLSATQPAAGSTPKTNQEALRFTVAAASAGGLDLDVVWFKLTTSDQGSTNWNTIDELAGDTDNDATWTVGTGTQGMLKLYDTADMTTELVGAWTLYNSAGVNTTVANDAMYASFDLTTKKSISVGSYKEFSLVANTSDATRSSASVTGDKLQVEIPAAATVGSLTVTGITWDETGTAALTGIGGTAVKNLGTLYGTTITY